MSFFSSTALSSLISTSSSSSSSQASSQASNTQNSFIVAVTLCQIGYVTHPFPGSWQ